MLSSLRKKSDAEAPATIAWHPNFRNYERLPDTKAVRTSFFINGVALLVAVSLLLSFVYQEYNLHALKGEVADWESRIAAQTAASAGAVAEFKKFQALEKRVNEAGAFVDRPWLPSELVQRVGHTLPGEIIIDYIDQRTGGVTIRGRVRGTPGAASALASEYVARLQADEFFSGLFSSITLTSLTRQAATEELNLEVQLKVGAPAATPGGK